MDTERLCLMQVHAHPDDEASKGSGTTARYAAEGVRNVLVCCTGGEAGDILNPAVEHPGSAAALHEMRMAELRESVRVLGYDALHLLGYHDSGMPDTDFNARPDNFKNAPLDEAVGRLVKLIREEQPQVIITYRDEQNFYPHPDHIRVHEISLPAFDLAGDPEAYPDLGTPWQPSKLYYVGWSVAWVKALHERFLARGEESPYASWMERGFNTDRADDFTTLIDVGDYIIKRREALLAHRTQVDPTGFWMRLPDDVVREVFPWEEYVLARSLVDVPKHDGEFEDDLFAGIRTPAREQSRGLTLLVEFVVAKGKKEQGRSYAHVDGARIVGSGAGPAERPADVVFTITPDDAAALRDGSLDLSVGFMRGQIKMAGDFAALLRLLPLTSGTSPALAVRDLFV